MVMPWTDDAPAILEVWNQGVEDGHVVGDLLFGKVNPSGRVPTTYPKTEDDWIGHGHEERYPGVNLGEGYNTMTYTERLHMGYRSEDITPAFPFGYGLSYTTFELADVSVDGSASKVTVTATVTNTGDVAGKDVVQVYLGVPAEGQPAGRLVGFAKVYVEPGASEKVEIVIDADASNHPLSVWDVATHDFVVPSGEFTVYVGHDVTDDSHVSTFTV